MDYLPWVLVAVLAIVVIALLFALGKAKRKSREFGEQTHTLSDELDGYKSREAYFVEPEDRLAIATFIGDHLDDVAHPHRSDMVRILAKWGATR